MKSIEVVAAIIVKDGKVLATQRGYGDFKDYWEFPGGKIEKGESREEALKREIHEELDTEISVDSFLKTVEYGYPGFHLTLHCYLCSLVGESFRLLEHESARWLSVNELDSVDWLPADLSLVEHLKHTVLPSVSELSKDSSLPLARPFRIIFVCHGNICRSPMAEYIFRKTVSERKKDFAISSAAVTYEEQGNDIYPPAKRILTKYGIPFGKHSAHRITAEEAESADLIVVMDKSNFRLIQRIIPQTAVSKVHLMMEYAMHRDHSNGNKTEIPDVADPWYTGDFEITYSDLLQACKGLAEKF